MKLNMRPDVPSIAEEIHAKWGLDRVAMIHRVGRLEIGEVSVAVAVASAVTALTVANFRARLAARRRVAHLFARRFCSWSHVARIVAIAVRKSAGLSKIAAARAISSRHGIRLCLKGNMIILFPAR